MQALGKTAGNALLYCIASSYLVIKYIVSLLFYIRIVKTKHKTDY